MDVFLDDEQRALRARVRALVEEYVRPRWRELDETTTVSRDLARLLAEERLLGLVVPAEYGGAASKVEALSIALVREPYLES